MNTQLRVFLACALGALVGSLVALQINPQFWWVGILAGGSIGYIFYAPIEVLEAIEVAWRTTVQNQEFWEGCHTALWSIAYAVNVYIFCVPLTISFFLALGMGVSNVSMTTQIVMGLVLGLIAAVMLSLLIILHYGVNQLQEDSAGLFIKKYNLLTIYLWHGWKWLWLGIVWLVWTGVPTAAKFVALVFRLIHSEFRLLCAFDAAVGAVVGYAVGNALVGAVVGGLLGVVNYEFISVRWLKLVPR